MGQRHVRSPKEPTERVGHPEQVVWSMVHVVRTVLDDGSTWAGVMLAGDGERLREVAAAGERVAGGRLRSSRRRQVLESGRAILVPLRHEPGRSLGIFPIRSEDRSLGVVEVVGPTDLLDERRRVVEAVVAHSGDVLRASQEMLEAERASRSTEALLTLTRKLLESRTKVAATRAAAALCREHLAVPLVALLPDRSGRGWYVAALHGFGTRKRAELRRVFQGVPTARRREPVTAELEKRFSEVGDLAHVLAIRSGDAVLLVGGAWEAHEDFLITVGSLLGEALSRIGDASAAMARSENMDLGIAWTAHELRAPLVGARAALDLVLSSDERADDRELLRRTRRELEQLSELVDPLLRWSVGRGSLRKRHVDLVQVVREAAATCGLEANDDRRIVLDVPDRVELRADPRQLRGAISNVLRNALAFSPPDSAVRVTVEAEDGFTRVYVKDQGPGVPASERQRIFDPFARGQTGRFVRGGRGLGLFIARRIVEVHGGTITVQPSRAGAVFCIELPIETEGRQASAS